MAQQQLKYKVVLDTSDVPQYLDQLKQQVNAAMTPQQQFVPAAYGVAPPAAPPFSNTVDSIKSNFFRAKNAAMSADDAAHLLGMDVRDYTQLSNQDVGTMDPLQLLAADAGVGYNPYLSDDSPGMFAFKARQRLMDNTQLGAMDYSFKEFAGMGMAAGSTIGGLIPGFGLGGSIIGGGVGVVAGSGAWLANEALSPFTSEGVFRRNISRGLLNYGRSTVMGYQDYGTREDIANLVANEDVSKDLLGTGTNRDEVEMMFNTAIGTQYLQTSDDASVFKTRLQSFLKDYTKLQHLTHKAGKDLGEWVDAMQSTGLTDMFNGDLAGATNYVVSSGVAARILDPERAIQTFQSGAGMLQGTGIRTAAGGDLLIQNIADITNMLHYRELRQETVDQLGGVNNAAAMLEQSAIQTAMSPAGTMTGFSLMNGNYRPGMDVGSAYISGLSGINSYQDYIQQQIKHRNWLGDNGSLALSQNVDVANKLNMLNETGFLPKGSDVDTAAQVYADRFGMDFNTAKLQITEASRSPESINRVFDDKIFNLQRNFMNEQPSALAVGINVIGNQITEGIRNVGSWIGVGNTELPINWESLGLNTVSSKEMKGNHRLDASYDSMLSLDSKDKITNYLKNGFRPSLYEDIGATVADEFLTHNTDWTGEAQFAENTANAYGYSTPNLLLTHSGAMTAHFLQGSMSYLRTRYTGLNDFSEHFTNVLQAMSKENLTSEESTTYRNNPLYAQLLKVRNDPEQATKILDSSDAPENVKQGVMNVIRSDHPESYIGQTEVSLGGNTVSSNIAEDVTIFRNSAFLQKYSDVDKQWLAGITPNYLKHLSDTDAKRIEGSLAQHPEFVKSFEKLRQENIIGDQDEKIVRRYEPIKGEVDSSLAEVRKIAESSTYTNYNKQAIIGLTTEHAGHAPNFDEIARRLQALQFDTSSLSKDNLLRPGGSYRADNLEMLRSSGSKGSYDMLEKEAESLTAMTQTAIQVRTIVNPDGTTTSGVNKDQIQATSLQTLDSINKGIVGLLNINRSLLSVSVGKSNKNSPEITALLSQTTDNYSAL